ncbi:hypothetical protein ACFQ4C_10635 [Larkinella insperata]|uniref:DUF1440 domain-containing protein n=1 Tax=Larkinella insperata TaxID=332158 RepID=A0ABW3QIB6_9BACT|nr:hypothetical protein [Larkinella insperata]
MNEKLTAETIAQSLGSGLAGAFVLTVLHESVRRVVPEAPRADLLGMRAIAKGLKAAGQQPPPDDKLHTLALGGDIVANTLYYSLVGLGGRENAWLLGSTLGAAAGVGAVALPGPMGLGTEPSARTPATAAMTIGWYLVGGLAAAAVYQLFGRSNR